MPFLRQLLIYGVAGAASRLVGVVLVPLYTHALTLTEYGTFEVLLALYLLAVLISGWQSESCLARDYHEASEGGWERRLTWSAMGISMAGFGIVALSVLILSLTGAAPALLSPYLPWLVALVLPTQLFNLQLTVLRFSHRPLVFATFSVADLVVSAVASIVFVIWCGLGIVGALAGLLVGKSLVCLLAWGGTFGRIPARPEPDIRARVLRYGTPLMIPVLLNWGQKYGTGILIALLLTLSDVGIAGIALKIAAVFEIAAMSFRQAWDPFAFSRLGDPEAAQPVFSRALAFYTILMGAAAGAVTLLAPLGVAIAAPPEYAFAGALSGLFILGQFWIGAVSILAVGIHGARRTSRIAYAFLGGSILNILVILLLSRSVGLLAAGAGFLASSILTAMLAAHFSERSFAIRFDWRLLIVTAIATAAFAAVCYMARAFVEPFATLLPISPEIVCLAAFFVMMAALSLIGENRKLVQEHVRIWKP